MIPNAAVEAAAVALFEKELGRPMEVADEGLYAEDIEACREDARAALEAAAPHMLPGASQEAVDEMAKVITTHHLVDDDACDCNEMFYDTRLSAAQIVIEHGLHVAMELHRAGFGRPTP